MAATVEITLTGGWQNVATAGACFFSPRGAGVVWAVTMDTNEPTFAEGHPVPPATGISPTLTGSERLWVKGSGKAFLTAEGAV